MAQNVEVVATNSDAFYPKDTLLSRAKTYAHLGPPQLREYTTHYWEAEIDTGDAPILTDDYAPVDDLLNPISGQPYVREEAEGSMVVEEVESFQLERTTLRLDSQLLVIIVIGVILSLTMFIAGRKKPQS